MALSKTKVRSCPSVEAKYQAMSTIAQEMAGCNPFDKTWTSRLQC